MKKIKTLFFLTLCFAILTTATPVAPNHDINPCGHHLLGDDDL